MSASTGKVDKLRFALMIDGAEVPSWASTILHHLSGAKEVEAVACISLADGKPFEVSSIQNICLFDSKVSPVGELEPLELGESWQSRFESLDIDFVLSLTSQTPPDAWLTSTLYGFWRYRFGDTTTYGQFGVSEVLKKAQWQEVDFERISSPSSPTRHILMRGFFKFHRQSMRYHREATLHQCARWPTEISRQVIQFGGLNFTNAPTFKEPKHTFLDQWKAQLISFAHQIRFQFDRIHRQFIYQQWNIGTIASSIQHVLAEGELKNVVWWPAPKAPMCLADPFPVIIDGQLQVLAEQFSYIDHLGAIVSFETDSRGLPVRSRDAIRLPLHISYPCLVQENGETYAAF